MSPTIASLLEVKASLGGVGPERDVPGLGLQEIMVDVTLSATKTFKVPRKFRKALELLPDGRRKYQEVYDAFERWACDLNVDADDNDDLEWSDTTVYDTDTDEEIFNVG